jgi:hypothetical protein
VPKPTSTKPPTTTTTPAPSTTRPKIPRPIGK